jgi:predicted small integral membrane protein
MIPKESGCRMICAVHTPIGNNGVWQEKKWKGVQAALQFIPSIVPSVGLRQ